MTNSEAYRDDHGRYNGSTAPVTQADIKRLDELAAAESRRMDGLLKAQETAVNAALAAAEKAVAAALAASEKAVNKAEIAQQRVNETQNEFRGTLSDQANSFMPRAETESLVRELRALIDAGNAERARLVSENQNALSDIRSRLDIGPTGLASLKAQAERSSGKQVGNIETRTFFFAIGAAVVGILGLILGVVSFISSVVK
jgi:hypothetical protein